MFFTFYIKTIYFVHTTKKNDFFIYYEVISRKFRGKFLDLLQRAYVLGDLIFKGKLLEISGKRKFADFIVKLYKKEWAVNIQPPMGKPEKVLEYLSRYVFRIAITTVKHSLKYCANPYINSYNTLLLNGNIISNFEAKKQFQGRRTAGVIKQTFIPSILALKIPLNCF